MKGGMKTQMEHEDNQVRNHKQHIPRSPRDCLNNTSTVGVSSNLCCFWRRPMAQQPGAKAEAGTCLERGHNGSGLLHRN